MKKENNKNTLKWLYSFSKGSRLSILSLILIQIVTGAISVFYALSLKDIINNAVAHDNQGFKKSIIIFVLLIVTSIILRFISKIIDEKTRSTIENKIKGSIFSSILNKDFLIIERIHSQELVTRLTSDSTVVSNGVVDIIPSFSGMVVRLVASIVTICLLEPKFLYLIIPAGIILIIFSTLFRKVIKRLHKNVQESDSKVRINLQESLDSEIIIRAYSKENDSRSMLENRTNNHKKQRMIKIWFSSICNSGFSIFMNGAYILGAILCGLGILNGTMDYGNFVAILELIGQVQGPFANITSFVPKYYSMIASAERLIEIEELKNVRMDESLTKDEVDSIYNDGFEYIEFKNASFGYPNRVIESLSNINDDVVKNVFSGFNFRINKNEYIALTGKSGCGKSTLLKLIMCLYDLNEGERNIIINSETKELNLSYRELFSYVPQGNMLMNSTIREIVAYKDLNRINNDEEIFEALKIADAYNFVTKLPLSIDTELGERGTGLSEGEMQRLAIARAVFSKAPIILLDEATSALDEETEMTVLNNIKKLTNSTMLIVTHKKAALSICDKEISFSDNSISINSLGGKTCE